MKSQEVVHKCIYPSEVDTMPVGTVKVTEYTQTGILEAYVMANGQVDLANMKLGAIREFVQQAKEKEREAATKKVAPKGERK